MVLAGEKVALSDFACESDAGVARSARRARPDLGVIRVDEIVVRTPVDLVPANLRHLGAVLREAPDLSRYYAKKVYAAVLLRAVEQNLHSKAYPKERLSLGSLAHSVGKP